MAPLSIEPHTCSEPASRASEPAQPAPVRFSFRSAPRRYTVALAFLCLLVVVLVAVLVAIVVSRRGQPEVGSLVAAEEMDARAMGPTYHLHGSRSLACRDAYVFACSAAEIDLKCRRQYVTVRPVPAAHINVVDDPKTNGSTALAKARMFYRVCVREGNASVAADLLRVTGVDPTASPVGHEQLFSSVQGGFLLRKNICDASVPLFIRLGVRPASGSQPAIVTVEPAGFAFPSYEYYADGAPKHQKELLQAYRQLIEKVTDHLRDVPASRTNSAIADVIINYERRLLERLRPLGNLTEPYRKTNVAGLKGLVPIIKWDQLLTAFFQGQSITNETPVFLSQPHYFQGLSQIISTTDTTTLNHYIMWRMAMKYAPHLDKQVRSLYYRFMQTINGAPDVDVPEEEWWEQCARHTSHYLGHAVGKLYSDTLEGKELLVQQAREIAEQVRQSASDRINSVAWIHMKQPLKDKIKDVQFQLGYSRELTDKKLDDYYLNLIVKLGSHLDNVFEAEKFLTMKQAALLRGRRDSKLDEMWPISPQDTEAIYQYEKNTVVVPLAALQKPIFSLDQHKALQYGSFGSLVGSLMFKTMDRTGMDMGSQPVFSDNATRNDYQAKLRCLAESYPSLSKEKDLRINGQLTAGEALADVAGLVAAYQAFKERANGMERLPGLDWSPEQLFFIGYAQSMCESIREERVVNWNATSTSAPNRLRVLQTLQQVPEFAAAFQCSAESEMRRNREPCYAW